jgi:transposase
VENRKQEIDQFQQALGLPYPWFVRSRSFNLEAGQFDIYLDLHEHPTFTCSVCGSEEHLSEHQGTWAQIKEYCSDMSGAFLAGMQDNFPDAQQTIDKFHVMKLLGDAVDETRRKEQQRAPELKKTRYLWLRNERDLTTDQKSRLATLSTSFLKTAKAYQLKVAFQEFWNSSVRVAPLHMQIWYGWAMRSKVPDMMKAAQTIRKHAMGILHWFESRMTNGLIEAINGLIQAAKRRARGYRTTRNLITMIYLIGAALPL